MSNTKTVKTRDSAAAILRKMGVAKGSYNRFIKKLDGGGFEVDVGGAAHRGEKPEAARAEMVGAVKAIDKMARDMAATVKARKEPKPPKGKRAAAAAKKAAAPPKPDKPKPDKPKRVTVTSVTEELILAGKSNADVWAVIKEQFLMSDDKRWYPSWFRSRLKRQGRLEKKS